MGWSDKTSSGSVELRVGCWQHKADGCLYVGGKSKRSCSMRSCAGSLLYMNEQCQSERQKR
jgi:hypothetical protein